MLNGEGGKLQRILDFLACTGGSGNRLDKLIQFNKRSTRQSGLDEVLANHSPLSAINLSQSSRRRPQLIQHCEKDVISGDISAAFNGSPHDIRKNSGNAFLCFLKDCLKLSAVLDQVGGLIPCRIILGNHIAEGFLGKSVDDLSIVISHHAVQHILQVLGSINGFLGGEKEVHRSVGGLEREARTTHTVKLCKLEENLRYCLIDQVNTVALGHRICQVSQPRCQPGRRIEQQLLGRGRDLFFKSILYLDGKSVAVKGISSLTVGQGDVFFDHAARNNLGRDRLPGVAGGAGVRTGGDLFVVCIHRDQTVIVIRDLELVDLADQIPRFEQCLFSIGQVIVVIGDDGALCKAAGEVIVFRENTQAPHRSDR